MGRSNSLYLRAVVGFGTLIHWHESSNKARILVKVLVPSADVIPESLLLVVGDDPGARMWDVSCFILHEDFVFQPPDEDTVPAPGVEAHPLPPPLPRWLGLVNQASLRQPAPGAQLHNLGGNLPDGAPAAAESVMDNQRLMAEEELAVPPSPIFVPLHNASPDRALDEQLWILVVSNEVLEAEMELDQSAEGIRSMSSLCGILRLGNSNSFGMVYLYSGSCGTGWTQLKLLWWTVVGMLWRWSMISVRRSFFYLGGYLS